MKKKIRGIIAIGICATLFFAAFRGTSGALAEENDKMETVSLDVESLVPGAGDVKADGTEKTGLDAGNILTSLLNVDGNGDSKETTKEETVYVVADALGNAEKIIVSDWIKNKKTEKQLNDKTILTDIVNVKGDETFSKNGEACVWEANGSDISYQGRTDKELPVKVRISYELDGKSVSPSEIKGKSGHVVIRFDYENNAKEEVEIDGVKTEMNVPFIMLTGVLFDDDKFENIHASNAKLINDGTRTVVIGVSFSGLQENLAIDRSKLEIPDHLEISADVKDFGLAMSLTVATSELFGRLNTLDIKDLDNLSESMAELTGAMQQLMDGSGALSDGMAELLEKSGSLESGIGALADGSVKLKDGLQSADDGAGKLKDGAGKLSDGAGSLYDGISQLKDGTGKLKSGTESLSDGAGKLSDGIGQVDDGALELSSGAGTLSDGIGQLSSGAETLSAGAGQLKDGLDTLAGNNEALMGGAKTVFDTMLQTAEQKLKEGGASIPSLTTENYGEVLDGVLSQINTGVALLEKTNPDMAAAYKEKAAALETLKASLDSYSQFYAGLKSYTEGVAQAKAGAESLKNGIDQVKSGTGALKDGADQLKAGLERLKTGTGSLKDGAAALKNGADTVKDGVAGLDSGADQIKTGAGSLKDGIDQLKDGAGSLKDGTGQLLEGAVSLSDGLDQLNSNIPALKDGIGKLNDGSAKLRDGIKEFNEKGIQKIVDAVEGDLEGLISRLRATGQAADKYRNFAGIADGMNGQVKFIFRTEEI